MKIAAWLVVKDEEYYVDMAIKSVAPYVDGVYVQDQYSTDNTAEIIEASIGSTPLRIDKINIGLEKFNRQYNEPFYRSLAISCCEEHFKPDWILQIDGDEIYTPQFFETVKKLDQSGELSKYNGVRHATERFIAPQYYAQNLRALQTVNGQTYHDPHTRFWRAGRDVRYVSNPGIKGFFHCIPRPQPDPILWIPGIMHIHLHRTFGPKAFPFWKEGGDLFEQTVPFNPKQQAPKWFDKNMEEAVFTDFQWPDYVMEKWNKWGCYD